MGGVEKNNSWHLQLVMKLGSLVIDVIIYSQKNLVCDLRDQRNQYD